MNFESPYNLGATGDVGCIPSSRRVVDIPAGELTGYSDVMVADGGRESEL